MGNRIFDKLADTELLGTESNPGLRRRPAGIGRHQGAWAGANS